MPTLGSSRASAAVHQEQFGKAVPVWGSIRFVIELAAHISRKYHLLQLFLWVYSAPGTMGSGASDTKIILPSPTEARVDK